MLVRSFREIGDPQASATLLSMAVRNETKNPPIAIECVRTIASFGNEGLPYLVQALILESPALRNVCLEELRDLSGEDFGNDPGAWREWLTKNKDPNHGKVPEGK
jgi:hypothetical protein